jgi:hypothetical protein
MKKSRPVSRAAYAIYTVKLDYDAVAAEVKRRRQIKNPQSFPSGSFQNCRLMATGLPAAIISQWLRGQRPI